MNRSACESYEVHLSALMDGEAAPTDVLSLLEHLPACASCQQFLGELRELQNLVDELPVAPGSTQSIEHQARQQGVALLLQSGVTAQADDDASNVTSTASPAAATPRRIVALETTPRWIVALAAALLVMLGFGLGDRMGAGEPVSPLGSNGELVVEIGADAGRMSEERFVSLAVELLRSDRKYRDKMSQVLQEVAESRPQEGFDSELTNWRDESSAAVRSEDSSGVGMREILQLSPLNGVY